MDLERRKLLFDAFKFGGALACYSLGFSPRDIAWASNVQKAKKKASAGNSWVFYQNSDDCSGDRKDASSGGGSCDIQGTETGGGTTVTSNYPCTGSYSIEIDGTANNYISWPLAYNVATLDGSLFIEFSLYISVDNDGMQTLLCWYGNPDNYIVININADQYITCNYRASGVNAWFTSTTAVTGENCTQIQVKCDPTAGSDEVGIRVCNDGACNLESWEYDTDNISKFAVNLTSLEVGEGNGGANNSAGQYHIDEIKVWDNAAQT